MMFSFLAFKSFLVSILFYLIIGTALAYWPNTQQSEKPDNALSLNAQNVASSHHQAWEYSQEQSYIARDGQSLYYRFFPSKSPTVLILLHGPSTHGLYLSNLSHALQDKANIVLPDLRGHGLSAHKRGDIRYSGQLIHDLEDLILQIKAKYPKHKMILGGHSVGANLAMQYAKNLSSTSSQLPPIDGFVWITPLLNNKDFTRMDEWNQWAQLQEKRLIGIKMLNLVTIDVLNHLSILNFKQPKDEGDSLQQTSYSYRMVKDLMTPNAIPTLNHPSLIVLGQEDNWIHSQAWQEVVENHSNIQLALTMGASHWDLVENRYTALSINAWLATLP